MSRRLHIRPRPGVNPLALLAFLLFGTGGTPKPSRAEERSGDPGRSTGHLHPNAADGETVRLTFLDGSKQEWRLAGATEDSLIVIGNPCAPPTSIPFDDVRRIERRENGNALVGFLGGTAAGFATGILATEVFARLSNDPYALYWGVIIVPVGTVAGMVAGTMLGAQPRWHEVRVEPGTELGAAEPDVGEPELVDVSRWEMRPSRRSSLAAVAVGGGLGLGAGVLYAVNQNAEAGSMVPYAMGGLLLGAVVGGVVGSSAPEESEWRKVFVAPQPKGLMVGYSTRF